MDKKFQLSLFPGISSNGIYSARFYNKFSINLISGLSAGNEWFEIGGISNLNTVGSTGIQIAGLANVVGTNSFVNLTLAEERALKKDGFTSDFHGIQFSGVLNYARNNANGIRITGGLNMNNGAAEGFQLAGLGNMVGQTMYGAQISGLYNIAIKGISGAQISLLFNHTRFELAGLQIGAINKSSIMRGKHSQPSTKARSVQIGLLNMSKKTGGTQIGLINIGKEVRGYQIGLINIFSPVAPKEYGPYNTPIGLLNFGTKGSHVRVTSNETFLMEAEITTGSCYNCSKTMLGMPLTHKFKKMNQNAIILGMMAGDSEKWGVGYGFRRVLYNKAGMVRNKAAEAAGQSNNSKMLSMGYSLIKLNQGQRWNKRLDFINRAHVEVGKLFRKTAFIIVGGSLNFHVTKTTPIKEGVQFLRHDEGKYKFRFWPGYTFGLQF